MTKNQYSSKDSRYPNGYMGKITYWTSKLNDEVMNTKSPDIRMIESIHRKLDYFIGRQWEIDFPQAV